LKRPTLVILGSETRDKAAKDIWQNFVDKVGHFIPKSNWNKRFFE